MSYRYTEYPSGAVLCMSKNDSGSVVAVCRDLDVAPIVRADRARQEVDRIMMIATGCQIESAGNNVDTIA